IHRPRRRRDRRIRLPPHHLPRPRIDGIDRPAKPPVHDVLEQNPPRLPRIRRSPDHRHRPRRNDRRNIPPARIHACRRRSKHTTLAHDVVGRPARRGESGVGDVRVTRSPPTNMTPPSRRLGTPRLRPKRKTVVVRARPPPRSPPAVRRPPKPFNAPPEARLCRTAAAPRDTGAPPPPPRAETRDP